VRRVVFVADFFSNQVNGGGENNDAVLINFLRDKGVDVETVHARDLAPADVNDSSSEVIFIISNFIGLSEVAKKALETRSYIIYEHDHKYVATRDPSKYPGYSIPPAGIINHSFYKEAKKVVVLSQICKDILEKELKLNNVHSISTSLWSQEKFEFIRELAKDDEKPKKTAVLESQNPTKGMTSAVAFCRQNNIEFELISSPDQKEFLKTLNHYENLVFIPQVLETFCRLIAEAKMLNCNVYTKKALLGFMSEGFSDQCGEELISTLEEQVSTALDYFYDLVR
jgi:hypothetical protein